MFWRRRRLPEDDEPLIPRGMIWQATGDDSPEHRSEDQPLVMQENSPQDAAIIPEKPVLTPVTAAEVILPEKPASTSMKAAEVIIPEQPAPMTVKAVEEPQFGTQPATLATDPGILSPPRGWPRVDDAEVARRSQSIDYAVSFPHLKPILSSAVPDSFEEEHDPIAAPAPPRPSLITPVPRAPFQEAQPRAPFQETKWEEPEWKIPESADLRDLQPNLQTHAREAFQTDLEAKVETDELRSVGAPADWQPQEAASSTSAVPGPSVLSRLNGSTAKSAAFATASALFATKSAAARFDAWREASSAAIANATSKFQSSWQRVRAAKVRVRIPATSLRLVTGIRGHAKAVRARTQNAIRNHENLWTSLAMAALSVLLAFGVVAGLRRYDPSYTAAASETANVTTATAPQAISAAAVPVKAAGAPRAKQKPSPMVVREPMAASNAVVERNTAEAKNPERPPVIAASRKTVIAPAVAAKPKPKTRRRSTEYDDYVAADTYVRYGSNGKRTR